MSTRARRLKPAAALLLAAAIALARTVWFHFRVLKDERGLTARFGEPYLGYMRRVNRWLPGLF